MKGRFLLSVGVAAAALALSSCEDKALTAKLSIIRSGFYVLLVITRISIDIVFRNSRFPFR